MRISHFNFGGKFEFGSYYNCMQFDYVICFDFQDWLLVAPMMKHWNYGVWKQDAVRPPFGVTGAGYCVCMYPGLLTLAYFCLVLMTSLLKVGKYQKVYLFPYHLICFIKYAFSSLNCSSSVRSLWNLDKKSINLSWFRSKISKMGLGLLGLATNTWKIQINF